MNLKIVNKQVWDVGMEGGITSQRLLDRGWDRRGRRRGSL